MRFPIVALPLILVLTAQDTTKGQDPIAASDVQVYRAVLDHTVRPYVVNFSNRMDAQPPYPLLVLNESIHLCGQTDAVDLCFGSVMVDTFMATRLSGDEARLAQAFNERNMESGPIPPGISPDVILVPRVSIDAVLKERKDSAVGFLKFSRPGYLSNGEARVWVEFNCRGCSRGWSVHLRSTNGRWRVESARQTTLNRPTVERLNP